MQRPVVVTLLALVFVGTLLAGPTATATHDRSTASPIEDVGNPAFGITGAERQTASESYSNVELLMQGTGGQAQEPGSNTVMFVGLLLIVAVLGAGLAYQRGVFERLPTRGDDGGTTAESIDNDTSPSSPSKPEVVSDRDRVKDLLADHDGRMKQVRIVDETDWSKSKVSMLLSEMDDDGDISKLRVGRENIVSLSGHEPDAAGSPFDDE